MCLFDLLIINVVDYVKVVNELLLVDRYKF